MHTYYFLINHQLSPSKAKGGGWGRTSVPLLNPCHPTARKLKKMIKNQQDFIITGIMVMFYKKAAIKYKHLYTKYTDHAW